MPEEIMENEEIMEEISEETPAGADGPGAFMAWRVSAYMQYKRGSLWYVIAGLLGGGLLTVAVWTHNYLFAILIVMVGVVMIVHGGIAPPEVNVEIGPTGIRKGEHFYPYKTVKNFWIVFDPPLKSLNLIINNSIFPVVHIPIDDQDPVEVRETLKSFIVEDKTRDSETVGDLLSRIFKI